MKPLRACGILFVIAFGFGVVSFLATRYPLSVEKLDFDEREYYDLASTMLDGTYSPSPRRTIGAPLLLATLRTVTGDNINLVQLLVIAWFSLTAPLTFMLVRREISARVGWFAGLGVACWPLFVRCAGTLYSEPFALPLLVGTLLAKPTDFGEPRWRWVLTGIMLGLCMHVRPMYLLYAPLLALVVVLQLPKLRPGLMRVGFVVGGCLLIVLPWTIMISLKQGEFVLISQVGGETLAGGLNPVLLEREAEKFVAADGRETWIGPGKWLQASDTGYLTPQESKLPYSDQDRLLRERAMKWIIEHPSDVVYIEMRKLSYMWCVYPFWNGKAQTILGNVPTIGLMGFGLFGMIRHRREWRVLSPFWTLPLFVSVVALIAWGSWRFRQPGDLGLIVLAAMWIGMKSNAAVGKTELR